MEQKLIRLLEEGNYSCVLAKNGEKRTYTRKGVADLYNLVIHDPEFLQGASLADKVIGKGAAALIIKGGIAEIYTHVISRPALELLRQHGLQPEYTQITDHIINRNGDDWCPVEKLCYPESDIEQMTIRIGEFLNSISKETKLTNSN